MLQATKLFYNEQTKQIEVHVFGTNMRRRVDEKDYFSRETRYYYIKRREILKLINTHEAKELIFMKGEPLIQMDMLDSIIRYLQRKTGIKTIIRTNGTIMPYCVNYKVSYIVEPWLSSTGKTKDRRLCKDILKVFRNRPTEWVFNPKTKEDKEEVEVIKKWVK